MFDAQYVFNKFIESHYMVCEGDPFSDEPCDIGDIYEGIIEEVLQEEHDRDRLFKWH